MPDIAILSQLTQLLTPWMGWITLAAVGVAVVAWIYARTVARNTLHKVESLEAKVREIGDVANDHDGDLIDVAGEIDALKTKSDENTVLTDCLKTVDKLVTIVGSEKSRIDQLEAGIRKITNKRGVVVPNGSTGKGISVETVKAPAKKIKVATCTECHEQKIVSIEMKSGFPICQDCVAEITSLVNYDAEKTRRNQDLDGKWARCVGCNVPAEGVPAYRKNFRCAGCMASWLLAEIGKSERFTGGKTPPMLKG